MAKRDGTQEKMTVLKAFEDAPLNQRMEKTLRKSLAGANNIVVAKAAKIVGKRGIENCIPALLKAFDYLIDIIENGSRDSAVAAVGVLEIFSNEHLRIISTKEVTSRNDVRVYDACANSPFFYFSRVRYTIFQFRFIRFKKATSYLYLSVILSYFYGKNVFQVIDKKFK